MGIVRDIVRPVVRSIVNPVDSRYSAFSWENYFADKSLFFLDGTISGDTFVDQSINSRDFTITGKDFADDWTKGFPYKSAATISPPVGDAVLIAADINNFLYDAGGTPNAIPVVSLFQNIDYEDTIYCKHEAQVLDANDVETYEPRVINIFMTASALSASDLVKANTYFGVPAEETVNMQWSAIDGDDATGDGSKATPYLTLGKAQAEASAGDIIYIKTGEYAEDFILTADVTLQKTGGSFLTDVAGGSAVLRVNDAGGTHSMGLIGRNIVYGLGLGVTFSNNMTFEKMLFTKVSATQGLYLFNSNNVLKNSVVQGGSGNGIYFKSTGACVVDTNLIKSAGAGDGIRYQVSAGAGNVIKNNKFIGVPSQAISLDSGNTGDIMILGNLFEVTTQAISSDDPSAITVNIISNVFKQANLTGSHILLNEIFTAINIQKNKITVTALDGRPSIKTINNSNVDISSNILNFTTVSAIDGIYITSSGANVITGCSITKNRIIDISSVSDILTIIGSNLDDGSTALCDGNIINENKIIGNSNDITNEHNILYGFSKGIVKHNYSENGYYGMVNKYDKQDGSDVFGNIFLNNFMGVILKGTDNVKIYNNTIINKTRGLATGILLQANSDAGQSGTAVEGALIKNNIIIAAESSDFIIKASTANDLTSADIDYNIYYATLAKPFRIATTNYSFAEWQALGHDAHSIFLTEAQFNALFTDYDNDDYSLADGSQAIGNGVALDAAYDDGLDASTDWGDTDTVPVVVTKQQTAPWDIGAYVS